MINYDKTEIKEQLTQEQIYDLLLEWGGEPEYTNFGILSRTICHNPPGEGSRKLYWYSNSNLFRCYTGCDEPTFDIFDLVCKVFNIQKQKTLDLNDAVRFIANHFGFSGTVLEDDFDNLSADNIYLNRKLPKEETNESYNFKPAQLKIYDSSILKKLNYNLRLTPWLNEGITQEVINYAQIGYYLGGDQITIPHFDKDGNFIGLRGRAMCQAECDIYGKYRPIIINQQMYNHPLGLNLYNLNNSKDNIQKMQTAIVFEGEKSVLLFQSYYGIKNDISVACCGSNLSSYQIDLLLQQGVREIVIAYDRQFQFIGDKEFLHLKNNLMKIWQKYHNNIKISFIFDKNMITNYKDAPIDKGSEIFLKLYKERIIL